MDKKVTSKKKVAKKVTKKVDTRAADKLRMMIHKNKK